jgi:hypothetical protein
MTLADSASFQAVFRQFSIAESANSIISFDTYIYTDAA